VQDPLALGATDSSLQRFREAELMNGRWAMLGAAGALSVEVLGQGNWYDAPLWAINGGSPTYLGVTLPFDLSTLLIIVRTTPRPLPNSQLFPMISQFQMYSMHGYFKDSTHTSGIYINARVS